jgi:hypothetical protein
MLLSVCLDTPLAFNSLGDAPIVRLMTANGFIAGDHLRSNPLLLCDDEDLSLAAQYVDPAIRAELVYVLKTASDSFWQFFDFDQGHSSGKDDTTVDLGLDAIADCLTAPNNVSGLFLETCALAARITHRTLSRGLDGLNNTANELDVMAIYDKTRFIGLKPWIGLPYVYVWVYVPPSPFELGLVLN